MDAGVCLVVPIHELNSLSNEHVTRTNVGRVFYDPDGCHHYFTTGDGFMVKFKVKFLNKYAACLDTNHDIQHQEALEEQDDKQSN